MLLAIDIGNSNVVVGVYQDETWKHIWRMPTLLDEAQAFYDMRLVEYLLEVDIKVQEVRKIVISSVVPPLNETFKSIARHVFQAEPLFLGPDIFDQLDLEVQQPQEIGGDLVANAVAALEHLEKDCIVVDFGTALTFTMISYSKRKILGVAIAPGLKTAVNVLFQKTAQLPEVPLILPESSVGLSTAHAIQSGVLIGYEGLVKHMLQQIRAELGTHFVALATGGLSSILSPLKEEFIQVDTTLTLDGLRIIWEKIHEQR